MIPKDQLSKLFVKQVEKHPDYKPADVLVQLVQVKPFAVSDGHSKVTLYSSNKLQVLMQESASVAGNINWLLNSFVVLFKVGFVLAQERGSEQFSVKLTCEGCSLVAPGLIIDKWGSCQPIEKRIDKNVNLFLQKAIEFKRLVSSDLLPLSEVINFDDQINQRMDLKRDELIHSQRIKIGFEERQLFIARMKANGTIERTGRPSSTSQINKTTFLKVSDFGVHFGFKQEAIVDYEFIDSEFKRLNETVKSEPKQEVVQEEEFCEFFSEIEEIGQLRMKKVEEAEEDFAQFEFMDDFDLAENSHSSKKDESQLPNKRVKE